MRQSTGEKSKEQNETFRPSEAYNSNLITSTLITFI